MVVRPGNAEAPCELTVAIPAFNEARRIEEPLRRVATYLRAHHPASEIVLADDGSTDGTGALVEGLAAELGVRVNVLAAARNRGKGHAVRRGMQAARGDLVLMTDADLSTPIDELAGLAAAIRAGADVAIGSRKMAGATIEIHQPALREAMGKVFTWLTRVIVVDVSDVTCGFKLFRRDAARASSRAPSSTTGASTRRRCSSRAGWVRPRRGPGAGATSPARRSDGRDAVRARSGWCASS